MSQVSTVIIISTSSNKDHLAVLNMWLTQHGVMGSQPLEKVSSESSAGDKYPQRTLYWGGFNFLDEDLFVAFFKTLKWEGTLLIIGSEEVDNGYRIVMGVKDDPASSIKLEIPSIEGLCSSNLEIIEFDPHEDPHKESDDYFKDLEL